MLSTSWIPTDTTAKTPDAPESPSMLSCQVWDGQSMSSNFWEESITFTNFHPKAASKAASKARLCTILPKEQQITSLKPLATMCHRMHRGKSSNPIVNIYLLDPRAAWANRWAFNILPEDIDKQIQDLRTSEQVKGNSKNLIHLFTFFNFLNHGSTLLSFDLSRCCILDVETFAMRDSTIGCTCR